MIIYKLNKSIDGVTSNTVNRFDSESTHVLSIPFDPANTDYQAYLKWVAEGNTPEPAEGQQ